MCNEVETKSEAKEQVSLSIEQVLMANTLTIFQNVVDGLLVKSGHEAVIVKLNPQQLNQAFRVFALLDEGDEALDALRGLHGIAPDIFPSYNKGKFCYLRVPFEAAQQMAKVFRPALPEGEKILKPAKKKK